jgi:hypothetical protein
VNWERVGNKVPVLEKDTNGYNKKYSNRSCIEVRLSPQSTEDKFAAIVYFNH